MQTTKLVVFVLFGLAMIDFSLGHTLHAAVAAKAAQPSLAVPKSAASSSKTAVKPTRTTKGVAAVYADKFNGRKTASGQTFRQSQLTAAHRSLPLGTTVRVTNLRTQQSVDVLINDRGPWHKRRLIDLSSAAATQVGMKKTGTALVMVEIVDQAGKS